MVQPLNDPLNIYLNSFRPLSLKEFGQRKNSVYDAVVYESEVERKFAEDLDKRADVKLFVKLPRWFQVETPIGFYNPDWDIVKEDDVKIYLVRETKATKDFEKLRNSEADKVRCGRKHFEALDVDFKVIVESKDL